MPCCRYKEGSVGAMDNVDREVEAHDAGKVGARSGQLILLLARMVGMILQDAGRKGHGHAELLFDGQLQVPNSPERQNQDQSIGQDVNDARDDEVELRVDTGAWDRRVPRFRHGAALEDDRQHIGEIEAYV